MPSRVRAQSEAFLVSASLAALSSFLPSTAFAATAAKHRTARVVDECADVRRWTAPQIIYSDLAAVDDVLRVTGSANASQPEGCQQPRKGLYCFATSKNLDVVSVYGPRSGVTLDVPDAPSRPLQAHWINSKLLYLEMWFNPHNGAFWIFDAERSRIVFRQLEDDGVQEWLHCRKDPIP